MELNINPTNIIFQGRKLINGEWASGRLLTKEHEAFIVCEEETSHGFKDGKEIFAIEWTITEVDPSSLKVIVKDEIELLMEIDVENYEETCGGCPTIFDFHDIDNTKYHFRLRNGYAKIVCEDTGEILIENNMNGFDGVCNWDDVIIWARNNKVLINY